MSVFYFARIEMFRTQPGTDGELKRLPAPLSKGDAIVYEKGTGRLTYVVTTEKHVEWNFSVRLCSMVSRRDDNGRESFVPGADPLSFTTPTDVARIRSYLVLAVTGHVGGLREEDLEQTVVWTIE